MSKFSQEYTVQLSAIDVNLKTKSTAILTFFQECFATYCAENKIAAYDIIKQNLIWVVASINLEILAPLPFWRETVKVEIWLSEAKKLRAYTDFKVYHNEKLIAQGDSCWFILDKTTRRAQNITNIIKPFELVEENVFGHHEFNKPDCDGIEIAKKCHKFNFNDLDFNGHVNNLSYISLASASIPVNYLNKYKIKKYSIFFLKECFLDENVTCTILEKNHSFCAKLTKENGDEACTIEVLCEKIG